MVSKAFMITHQHTSGNELLKLIMVFNNFNIKKKTKIIKPQMEYYIAHISVGT